MSILSPSVPDLTRKYAAIWRALPPGIPDDATLFTDAEQSETEGRIDTLLKEVEHCASPAAARRTVKRFVDEAENSETGSLRTYSDDFSEASRLFVEQAHELLVCPGRKRRGATVVSMSTLPRPAHLFTLSAAAFLSGLVLSWMGWPDAVRGIEFAVLMLAAVASSLPVVQPSPRDWPALRLSFLIEYTSLAIFGPMGLDAMHHAQGKQKDGTFVSTYFAGASHSLRCCSCA